MNWGLTWFIYAFALGIGSSLHCLGMCGPLVMSIPFGQGKWKPVFRFMSYSFSKAFMYGMLGFLPGLMGWSIKAVIGPWWISLLAGALVFIVALLPSYKSVKLLPAPLTNFINVKFQSIYNNPSWYFFMVAGGLNALLPCTMIWIALTASIATASPSNGFWFMFYFGLGTIPALGMVAFGKAWYLGRVKSRAKRMSSIITWMLVIALLLRGLLPGLMHAHKHSVDTISLCKPFNL
ncbi:MAG: sulfite exporter TauE/SafE family protein [Saprospiraceae bacterium]